MQVAADDEGSCRLLARCNVDRAVPDGGGIDANRRDRREVQRLAGAQAELAAVPRALDLGAIDRPLRERGLAMRAGVVADVELAVGAIDGKRRATFDADLKGFAIVDLVDATEP